MFAIKAGAYLSEAPFRCFTLGQVPGLTHRQGWISLPGSNPTYYSLFIS